jgi:apolipoprotein N-acyltransferase
MVPLIAVGSSAFLLWAAFPPLDLGPLALVAVAPLLWALRQVEQPTQAGFLGFAWGATFFGALLFWILQLGVVAWLPFTVFMGSITAVYAVLVWAFRLWPAWRWWLIVVAGWAAMEWLRGRFPFGGFPWGDVGYAAARVPGGLGSVQWIGPVGWSLLAVGFSAGIALLVESRENWRFAVDIGVAALLIAIAGGLFPPVADGSVLQVAIVQGGTPCPQVHCQNENQRIFERHLRLTEQIPAGSADLVVWAENSTGPPYEPVGNDAVKAEIVEQATRLGAYFLVSGTRAGEPGTFLNVNALFSPDGVTIGEYVKRHPVPFGEFVPMRGLLDFVPQLEQVPNDMVRGRDTVVFPVGDGVLGSVISFEGAFARQVRSMAVAGSTLMVVATNESSFGNSPASDQLIGLVRVNAAAVGQELVHAAITGRSAFIDAAGEVGQRTDLFEERVLYGRVQMRTAGPTVYTRFGDWVLLIALVGAAVALGIRGEVGFEVVGRRRSDR